MNNPMVSQSTSVTPKKPGWFSSYEQQLAYVLAKRRPRLCPCGGEMRALNVSGYYFGGLMIGGEFNHWCEHCKRGIQIPTASMAVSFGVLGAVFFFATLVLFPILGAWALLFLALGLISVRAVISTSKVLRQYPEIKTGSSTNPSPRARFKRCSKCGCHNDLSYTRCAMCGVALDIEQGNDLVVNCRCGHRLRFSPDRPGQQIKCSHCGCTATLSNVPPETNSEQKHQGYGPGWLCLAAVGSLVFGWLLYDSLTEAEKVGHGKFHWIIVMAYDLVGKWGVVGLCLLAAGLFAREGWRKHFPKTAKSEQPRRRNQTPE